MHKNLKIAALILFLTILFGWIAYYVTAEPLRSLNMLQKEAIGVSVHRSLFKTLLTAQELRGRVYKATTKANTSHADQKELADLVMGLRQNIAENQAQLDDIKLLHLQQELTDLQQALKTSFNIGDLNTSKEEPYARFTRQTVAIKQIKSLLKQVANNSDLLLDDQPKISYMVDLLASKIPDLSFELGYTRGRISGKLNQDTLLQDDEIKLLIGSAAIFTHLQQDYMDDSKKIDQDSLSNAASSKLLAQFKQTQDIISRLQLNNANIPSSVVFEQLTQHIDSLKNRYFELSQTLDASLKSRKNTTVKSLVLAWIALIIAYILTAWIIASSLLNIINQQALQSAKHFEDLFNNILDGILIYDQDGVIRNANHAASIIFGYTPNEFLSKEMRLLTIANAENAQENTPHYLKSRTSQELKGLKKEGLEFDIELSVVEMEFEEGTLFVGTVRDISARKKMELSLQQAYQNLEEFTAVASHDLKSPLRGIADLVQWIVEDLGTNISESVKHNLQRVQIRVTRLEMLIENLLLYSKIGKTVENLELIEPKHFIAEIIEIMPRPEGFNIHIHGDVAAFTGAKTPLETVLRNLIDNAIKHHDSSAGTVNIHISADHGFCVFEIADDGPGIPNNVEERIFKLFQTLSKTKAGTGLGLAVCKRMVEAHGGSIVLKSKTHNNIVQGSNTQNSSHLYEKGAVFCVRWPMNHLS